jgi:hypothetical protein
MLLVVVTLRLAFWHGYRLAFAHCSITPMGSRCVTRYRRTFFVFLFLFAPALCCWRPARNAVFERHNESLTDQSKRRGLLANQTTYFLPTGPLGSWFDTCQLDVKAFVETAIYCCNLTLHALHQQLLANHSVQFEPLTL